MSFSRTRAGVFYLGPVKIRALTPGGFTETETLRTTLVVVFLYVERAVLAQIARLTVNVRLTETFGIVLRALKQKTKNKKNQTNYLNRVQTTCAQNANVPGYRCPPSFLCSRSRTVCNTGKTSARNGRDRKTGRRHFAYT